MIQALMQKDGVMLKGNYTGTDDSEASYSGAGYSGEDDFGTDYSKADDYDINDFGADNPEAYKPAEDYFGKEDFRTDYPKAGYSRTKGASITKIMKNATVTFLFLMSGLLLILLIYSYFFNAGGRNFSGEWTAELNMTEQAAVRALDWLQDIEGVSVSLEEVESYMKGLTVRVNLAMKQTARFQGDFQCYIVPESYEACNQAAYEAFAISFRELLGERLRMSGYEGDTSQEAVEALVAEAFGMSTVSYLMSCGPTLLPSLEELQARYDGSGTYEVTGDIFIRQFDAGGEDTSKEEYYLRKDDNLILTKEADSAASDSFFTNYPVIYTLTR